MLKKKHNVKQKALVGGKDYRALRESCAAVYGLQPPLSSSAESSDIASLLADTCDVFLPKKASSSEKVSWLYPSASSKHCGANILSVNDIPTLVDVSSLRDLDSAAAPEAVGDAASKSVTIPTLFGILRLRQCIFLTPSLQSRWQHHLLLLPASAYTALPTEGQTAVLATNCLRQVAAVCWIHPPASRHIVRGAHVMTPGIIAVSLRELRGVPATQAGRLHAGDAILVCVRDNPVPFAVGIATAPLAAFVEHVLTANAPTTSSSSPPLVDTLPSSTIFFGNHVVPAGVGVVVAHSVNDQLWEEKLLPYTLASIQSFPQLPRDSAMVVPKSHQLSGGMQTSHEVAAGEEFPLLGWIAQWQRTASETEGNVAVVASCEEGENEVDAEGGDYDDDYDDDDDDEEAGDQEEPHDEEPEEVADLRRVVTSTSDNGAPDDSAVSVVDVAALFCCEDDVLDFAAMEAAKKFPPSSLPVLLNAFVAELCSQYPRVDAADNSHNAEGGAQHEEEHPREGELSTKLLHHRFPDVAAPFVVFATEGARGGIDFKKTRYKKALAFLTSPRLSGTFKITEPSPGVHTLVQINKSSEWLRSRRRKFSAFLVAHHRPVMDVEKNEADAMLLSDEGGGAVAMRKWRRGIAIEKVEVVYRPSRGMHPQLASILLAQRRISGANANEKEGDDDDEDEEDAGTAPAGTIRSNLKQYAATNKLFTTAAAAAPAADFSVDDKPSRATSAPPLIAIDEVLRQLWPANAKEVPDALRITELEALVFRQLCPMHRIFYALPRGAHPCAMPRQHGQLRNGAPPSVHVSKQRRGTKWVIVVAGLENLGFDATAVAEAWQQQFMTGVIVVDPSKGLALKSSTRMPVEVVVRGKNVSMVTTMMENTLGIPAPLIATETRKGPKVQK